MSKRKNWRAAPKAVEVSRDCASEQTAKGKTVPRHPRTEELNELLLDGLRRRILFPFLDPDGKIRWKHVEHTDDEELKSALTEEQVRAIWRLEDQEH